MELQNQNDKYAPSVPPLSMQEFSSTARLADEPDLRKSEEGPYNPFEHRNVEHPNSDIGALAHLLKSSLGSGILAMPLAFKNGGLAFGMAGTLIIGYICTHCVTMLVQCSHILCARARIPSMTFAETAEYAFLLGPPKIRKLAGIVSGMTKFQLCLTYLMSGTVYTVFVATSLEQVIEYNLKPSINIRLYILMLWLPFMALGMVRELKRLEPFSILANIFIVVSFAITLYYMFSDIPNIEDRKLIAPVDKMPLFFSTVIFAMEGIGVVMPVENQMKNPKHFLSRPWILYIAMSVVITLYAVIGFFGYLKYGDDTDGSITLNLPKGEALAQTVKILIALAIYFTYGLQFYVPTTIIWGVIKDKFPKERQNIYHYIMRIILVTGTVMLAVGIPNLGPIISLVGAVCFSILGLLLPAIIDIATRWESPGFGFLKWRLWKNIIISLLAIFALFAGAYTSILDIIDEYSK